MVLQSTEIIYYVAIGTKNRSQTRDSEVTQPLDAILHDSSITWEKLAQALDRIETEGYDSAAERARKKAGILAIPIMCVQIGHQSCYILAKSVNNVSACKRFPDHSLSGLATFMWAVFYTYQLYRNSIYGKSW